MRELQDVKRRIQSEINQKRQALKDIKAMPLEAIIDKWPNVFLYLDIANKIECSLPFSFPLIQEVKDFMVENFPEWEIHYERDLIWDASSGAGHFITYKNKTNDIKFDFGFRSDMEGSTCVLNQIGTKNVPVYEIVCSEAAKSWT